MSKLTLTITLYILNTIAFRQVPAYHLTAKRAVAIRRGVISILIALMAIENIIVPLAHAEQLNPSPKTQKEAFKTLITDTNLEGVDPYVGEGRGVKSLIPAITDLSVSNNSANVVVPARVHKLAKENYRPNEEIKVVIENGLHKEFKTELIDAVGGKVALETTETETGAAKVITINQPSSFRPGKYTLRISDGKGGVSEQDFSWGVLAINPDKSIYSPNETADLAIGVLDEGGNMVCDAQVELQITDPSGKVTSLSTDNGKVIINPECKSHNFTLKPDYETNYHVGGAGKYNMNLKAQTKNGEYSISDSFEVQNAAAFDVKRITATRIYPPNTYPVTMEITANQDFEGTVTESVPASFRIAKPGSQVLTEAQQVDKDVNASDSGILAPEPQLPNAPEVAGIQTTAILPFNTVNNLADTTGGERAVFGVTIPGLGMPFTGPFPVTQEFGENLVHMDDAGLYETFGMHGHDGIDFGMPIGTAIQAVDGGTVVQAGPGDYGTTVIVQHAWGKSYYGHLSEVKVKVGDQVIRGSGLALSGNSGITTGPHLHFSVKPDKNDNDNGYYGKVDPAYYLGLKQSAGVVLAAATKLQPETYTTPVSTDIQVLTWKINVKKGDKIKIGYNYLAPRISPQFYTLGPATFTDTNGREVFHEIRKWQIASDALEYKFKRGSFIKADCTAPCSQAVSGVGFRGKAVIFEWTKQTTEAAVQDQHMGVGFATSSSQQRAVSFWADDGDATSDTGRLRSDTKAIVVQTNGGTIAAQAEFASFDDDGFTLNWTTNNSSGYILHYTVLGGADVSNAKAGTFTLTTGTGSLGVTDPGFKPDFLMVAGTANDTVNTNVAHAAMNIGYAAGSSEEGAITINSESTRTTSDTWGQQRTDATVLLLTPTTGAQDAIADFTSFDTNGFTLNKSDAPAANTDIFYLAVQGGQYDVGALTQPSTEGESTISTNFRPVGVSLASENGTANTGITAHSSLSLGGASKDTSNPWCKDTTGVTCIAPDGTSSGWSERIKISINNDDSDETLTDFPLLVKLNSSRVDYNKTQNSGQDIRFVDPANPSVVLSHEIEVWNESGDSYVWVKIPQLRPGNNDVIWMYYNNPSAADGQDAANVWSNNYKAVYHMDEQSGTTNADSTANTNAGSKKSATEPNPTTSGPIDGAQDFDGTDDYVRANDSNSLDLGATGTMSVWFNRDGIGTWDALIAKGNANNSDIHNYAMTINTSNQLAVYWGNGSTTETIQTPTTLTSTTNNYYAASTWTGSNYFLYVNGAQSQTGTQSITPAANTSQLRIGEFGGNVDYFNGLIDEVRISSVPRSQSWIEAEYWSGTDAMNTFSSAESYASLGQSIYQSTLWSSDTDNLSVEENSNESTSTNDVLELFTSPTGVNPPAAVAGSAEITSFNSNGFNINWTTTDGTAREVLYWTVGSVTASQEDYRWYKNANSITPGVALEDENSSTIIAKNKPTARLRASMSVGGNGLNASSQGFKLQYAAAGAESAVGGTSDWCNDTTGVTCIAPGPQTQQTVTQTDWCNDASGITCDTNWQYRRKITINNSASGQTLTDFPLLVKLDSTRIDYSKTQSDGDDLRFVADGAPTVVLPHEIEGTWANSGTNYVWVKVTLASGSTTGAIYMYYGNNGASSGQDGTNVWDGSYKGVWHMTEATSTAGENYKDSTSTSNDGTGGGTGPGAGTAGRNPAQATGQIGYGQSFDGDNDAIGLQSNTLYNAKNAYTIDVWINPDDCGDTATNAATLFEKLTDISEFYICRTNDRTLALWINSTGSDAYSNTNVISFGVWQHIAIVYNGSGTVQMYVNGVAVGMTAASSTEPTSDGATATAVIGQDEAAGVLTSYNYDGLMDDMRISDTGRSADWLEAEYLTGTDAMNSFGSEQTYQTTTSTNGGWDMRKKITFNNADSTDNLANFPVLIKLDSSRIDYSKTQSAGQDIRFVDPSDPTTVLPHQIETWNESGASYVWVKVPQIDSGSASDYIWMYYDNPTVSDGQDATNVWDSNFKMVQHLNQNPATTCASTYEFCDSTSNANNGDNSSSMPSGDQVAGKIGGSLNMDNDFITVPDSVSLDTLSANMTVSVWVNAQELDAVYRRIIQRNPHPAQQWYMESDGGVPGAILWDSGNNSGSTAVLTTNKWYYLTMVTTPTSGSFYINGVLDEALSGTGAIGTTGDIHIGASDDGNSDWQGRIDEVRLSSSARSVSWIKASYLSENDSFASFGDESPYTTGGQVSSGWTDVADIWCNDASGVTCNTSWSTRKRVTINNQASSTNLTNFPVLIKLDSTRIDYSKTQNSGQDIRFVDPSDPTTALPHQIETWDENGTSYVWVKVPQLDGKSASDSIWMYYGNASTSDGQASSSVWDSNFRMVQHLNQNPGGSAPQMTDSTSVGQNGTSNGSMTSSNQITGQIDGALSFDGINDNIDFGNVTSLVSATNFTISAWMKRPTTASGGWVIKCDNSFANCVGLEYSSTEVNFFVSPTGSTAYGTIAFTDTNWHLLTLQYDGSQTGNANRLKGYIDGVPQTLSFTGTVPSSSTSNTSALKLDQQATAYWNSSIDEVRVSNTTRTSDWIKTDYLSQSDQINTFGNEETQTSAVWKFKDNASVSDGTTITSAVLGTSTSGNQMTYQESNPSSLIPTALAVGEKREFDFSLDGSRTSNRRTYYFRIVNADGTPMTNYTKYPSITVGVPNQKLMRNGKWFNYKKEQSVSF